MKIEGQTIEEALGVLGLRETMFMSERWGFVNQAFTQGKEVLQIFYRA